MKYLLDTCVLSELRRPRPDAGVVEWLGQVAESRLYLSVLTLGKIQQGTARLADGPRRQVQLWLETELVTRFAGRILPVDVEAALEWGLQRGEQQRAGQLLPVVDCLLAATAAVHHLVVVTRNVRDFERFPVRVLNPWAANS